MFRIACAVWLSAVAVVPAAIAQGGKTYQIAVGQKYRAGDQGGAPVAIGRAELVAYAVAREKQDTTAIGQQMKSGSMLILPQNSKIEILKIEPKSAEIPYIVVECQRTTGVIKDGKVEPLVSTVYMIPELFCQVFVAPADEATKTAALPADKPISRTWKAAEGGFEVEAELLAADHTSVKLKRLKDGKELSVPLDKLSADDRKWLTAYHKDVQSLLGKWKLESAEDMGQAKPPISMTLTFTKDQFTMNIVGADMEMKGTWTIDPTRSPQAIDLVDTQLGLIFGVYELKGDTLKICQGPPAEKDRPTGFATQRYLGNYFSMTLKKQK